MENQAGDSAQPSSKPYIVQVKESRDTHVGTKHVQIVNNYNTVHNHFSSPQAEQAEVKKVVDGGKRRSRKRHASGSASDPHQPAASSLPSPTKKLASCSDLGSHQPSASKRASSTSTHRSSPFSGKTLRDVFGPFLDVNDIGAHVNDARHKVKLFGKVLSTFCPKKPNKLDPEKKKRLGRRCRSELHLRIQFQMETLNGEKKEFSLMAFHDSVRRLKTRFKNGQRYIVCGVGIEKVPEPFRSSEGELHGIMDRTFVHQLSPEATLDTLVDDEIHVDGLEMGRIPLAALHNFKDWSPGNYIEGTVENRWKKYSLFVITISDETGMVNVVASGVRAQEFSKVGRIKIRQKYRIVKGNGSIVESEKFISASCPVQLKVGQNTEISLITDS